MSFFYVFLVKLIKKAPHGVCLSHGFVVVEFKSEELELRIPNLFLYEGFHMPGYTFGLCVQIKYHIYSMFLFHAKALLWNQYFLFIFKNQFFFSITCLMISSQSSVLSKSIFLFLCFLFRLSWYYLRIVHVRCVFRKLLPHLMG